MKTNNKLPVIGIIGCGPRGLSALESLYKEAANRHKQVRTLVFERSEFPGAGPVYNPQQPDSNWLNVSERAIDIPPREEIVTEYFTIPPFPNFQQWCGYNDQNESDTSIDRFPLRSQLGLYLLERFKSLSSELLKRELMEYVHGEVINVNFNSDSIQIDVLGGKSYQVTEAVMCIGHQPIEPDDQLKGWENRVSNLDNVKLYTQPYPLDRILELDHQNVEDIVAIRGFGLAMIDVLRSLTEGRGGTFEVKDSKTREMVYFESGREPKNIIPFSLNGLPMAPKPLNKKIDSKYVPTERELNKYSLLIKESMNSSTLLTSPKFLIEAIAPIIWAKFAGLQGKTLDHCLSEEEIIAAIKAWLTDEDFEHDLIISKDLSSETMMRKFIGMATGHEKVSLDFCIGHVWRHCQPTMYKLLSFAPLSDELISDIVALDERLKRYTYGPPVDSLQQVLALLESGNMTLDFVHDPNIELGEGGWKIEKNGTFKIANIMVNSVLDSPQIQKVISPLPKGLINKSEIESLCDTLGIRTEKDATIAKKGIKPDISFSVLGRLAKGTLIGVDAIAECFSDRSDDWAKGVISRYKNHNKDS
ncbi:FAD/NAD(P)-binding protein [Maribacter sp. 2210JD10-5]|uniref:FAD/NAD(P)-binding protein n=1 Tax=Maribacter sp. 2210JD10-5 TaxID=3386272 RepID=UPI0039BC593F